MKLGVNSCEGCYGSSLDVRFTKVCDNACSFCIERAGIDSLSALPNVAEMVLATKRSGKDTVLVLGGEPLLYPEAVLEYLKGIGGFIQSTYVTTSLPKTLAANEGLVVAIMESLTGLNVSLHHYDSDLNNRILNASSKHNRLELLRQLVLLGYSSKIRVSVNLVRGYLDRPSEIFTFLDTMVALGVSNVKLNELQHEPELYVSFERVMSYPMASAFSDGCQTSLNDTWLGKLYPSLNITLKRACGFIEPSVPISAEDIEKEALLPKRTDSFLVLYEDGSLHSSWKKLK